MVILIIMIAVVVVIIIKYVCYLSPLARLTLYQTVPKLSQTYNMYGVSAYWELEPL